MLDSKKWSAEGADDDNSMPIKKIHHERLDAKKSHNEKSAYLTTPEYHVEPKKVAVVSIDAITASIDSRRNYTISYVNVATVAGIGVASIIEASDVSSRARKLFH